MQSFGAPNLGLAIVQDGQPVVTKVYGVRKLGTAEMVDDRAASPIGSETKAFTATALAILVDRKQLSWDDRVAERLPGFQMYDPYATAHTTVRDPLTHRSGVGLGEGDLMVLPSTARSRADVVHAPRYLKPVTGFREKFAYGNILYIVAGALVEAVSGQSWEDFVLETIFKPVGMVDAHATYTPDAPNSVALHARNSGPFRGTGALSTLQELRCEVHQKFAAEPTMRGLMGAKLCCIAYVQQSCGPDDSASMFWRAQTKPEIPRPRSMVFARKDVTAPSRFLHRPTLIRLDALRALC